MESITGKDQTANHVPWIMCEDPGLHSGVSGEALKAVSIGKVLPLRVSPSDPGTMWPPTFGLLFLISASPLQAQEASASVSVSVEEETNALDPESRLPTNPAPSLGRGIVEKILTTRSGGRVGEREGREVELTTTKEGSIISDVYLNKKRIFYKWTFPQKENLIMPTHQHQPAMGESACPPALRWFWTGAANKLFLTRIFSQAELCGGE